MELKSILGSTRRADISFHASGRIDITSRVAQAIGLCSGDVIDILTDADEFYLLVARNNSRLLGRHEARCFPTKNGSRHFRCWSARLSSAILRACRQKTRADITVGEPVSIDGRAAVTLITHAITPRIATEL